MLTAVIPGTGETELRAILAVIPDATVVIDEAGTIRRFNPAAEQLFGYDATAAIGQPFTLLAPEEDRARHNGALQLCRQAEAGSAVAAIACRGQTARGRSFPMELRPRSVRIGKRLRFLLFYRDLSEQIAHEERIDRLRSEQARITRQHAIGDFAATLAHELNQPLTATANFLSAAQMRLARGQAQDQERIAELVGMAGEQVLRTGESIRRIRDLVARHDLNLCPEPVGPVVRDAVDLALAGAGRFAVAVSYALDPALPSMVVDRAQIRQVLVSLLRNAVQAQESVAEGRRGIRITTHAAPDGMIAFGIEDQGPGIAPDRIAQLAAPPASARPGGGLAVSRRIVEAHGGVLRAENRAEGGCRICFTVPAATGVRTPAGDRSMERQELKRA